MIQASDLRSGSAKSRGRPLSAKRELHGYDGPMQYLNKGNPDDMTTVQVMLILNLELVLLYFKCHLLYGKKSILLVDQFINT